jgi:6-phosphogluconate dehydrogenase
MKNQGCDIGLIGLGMMGRNLVLNIADMAHRYLQHVWRRTIRRE